MTEIQDDLSKDIERVKQIEIIPNMLDVVCQTTGMGFAAVARVTDTRWIACSVRDEVQFGLKEGDELKIETTICNEIRDHRSPVVIDHVDEDPLYKNHHTPKMYGLQSYISVPIILKDGSFFGTLCAIDSKPAKVNNAKVVGTFKMFAELLAFHLENIQLLEQSQKEKVDLINKNRILSEINMDLDNFVYTASHDLKSPIANVQGLLNILSDNISKETLDKGRIDKIISLMKTSLERFSVTLKDLTTFVESTDFSTSHKYEELNILEIVDNIKQDLNKMIEESNAKIDVVCEDSPVLHFSRKNFKSILYNLINNALKYRSSERSPEITINIDKRNEKTVVSVEDNGIGIPSDKIDEVFSMFRRFHNHVEGSGLGLYIVKRMIDNINGQVNVDSILNKGTKFTITF